MSETLVTADAELWFDRATRRYAPGDALTVNCRLADWGRAGVIAVEASVLWRTTGLGEEDYGVHWFDRSRVEPAAAEADQPLTFATTLPPSPLTYDGQILRIGWVARVRGFFPGGRQRLVEEVFQMLPDAIEGVGAVPAMETVG